MLRLACRLSLESAAETDNLIAAMRRPIASEPAQSDHRPPLPPDASRVSSDSCSVAALLRAAWTAMAQMCTDYGAVAHQSLEPEIKFWSQGLMSVAHHGANVWCHGIGNCDGPHLVHRCCEDSEQLRSSFDELRIRSLRASSVMLRAGSAMLRAGSAMLRDGSAQRGTGRSVRARCGTELVRSCAEPSRNAPCRTPYDR